MKAEQQQFHGGLPFETKNDLSVLNTLGSHGHLSHFGEAHARSLSSQQTHRFECRSLRSRHSPASRAWPSPSWAVRQCSRWVLGGWPNACATSPCLLEPSRPSILSWISTFLSWCRSSGNGDLSSPAETHIEFSLDPLAEYLAGLQLLSMTSSEADWNAFLTRVDEIRMQRGEVGDLLKAIWDCSIHGDARARVPDHVAQAIYLRAFSSESSLTS
jgi:hypothetical protein